METIKSGIYQIRNKVNGKIYIGSAINLVNREQQHFGRLRNNNNCPNKKFQYGFNKHGELNFIFEILEYIKDKKQLIKREQYYFDKLLFAKEQNNKFDKLGYNICRTAGSMMGVKVSKETRILLSKANKGKIRTPEQRLKQSKMMMGHVHSEETIRKITENSKKLRHTKEVKNKIGINCPHRKSVIQLDIETNKKIKTWRSMTYAHTTLGIQHIGQVCDGKRKTIGGYKWVWETDYIISQIPFGMVQRNTHTTC